jgi:L-seryl-tRNA(Ser) seleniumtransferase
MVTYKDLGIQPFINAKGTITTLGGSLMPDEVVSAMREAAGAFIDLNHLNVEAGNFLARRIGVEAAFISCGAASGVQLSAAACLTGTDLERVKSLPKTEGWKNEFVISSVDPHAYIHQGIELCGGKLVRAGSKEEVTAEDMLAKVGERTCAVVHFLGRQTREQLADVIAGCEKMGVPVMVDAAAQLPPRSNLVEIVGMGASLVNFSGGKGMSGPQSSGLVVGKKEFVDAVRMNASPNSGMGRGMKVGKEEILGLVTAVDLFLKGSDDDDRTRWESQVSHVVRAIQDCSGVKAYVLRDGQLAMPEFAPRGYIEFDDPDRIGDVIAKLLNGQPSVVARQSDNRIIIDPMTMRSGEEEIVAERLKDILS